MVLKRMVGTSALAAGIGLAGLAGFGMATATADPGQPCGHPGAPACGPAQPGNHDQQRGNPGPQQGNPGDDWQRRGVDQGRQDHRPFSYNGHQVTPVPAGNGDGWGFWLLGQWIRL